MLGGWAEWRKEVKEKGWCCGEGGGAAPRYHDNAGDGQEN